MKYKDYVDLSYKPKKSDLICHFYLDVRGRERIERAAGAVAAESSIGTWTEVTTVKRYVLKNAAKVFSIEPVGRLGRRANIKIAYPIELFEPGNMPNILSSIAGNVFGMKEVLHLRLNDIIFPEKIVKSFPGPLFGLDGVRKVIGVYDRPLLGTIVKPKLGLNTKDHAKVAYEAWIGGCDIVKDDENLSSQSFNKFEKRLKETLKMKRKAEKETGEKKIYMINVTAECKEMLRRAKLVAESGNEYLMVDVITAGWSALHTLRDENKDLKLVMHAHRAGHAALDKVPIHGISMKVLARIVRLLGCDQLHIGTAVGKMFETKEEVLANREALLCDFYGMKKVMPVSSGGLHPGMVPALWKIFGKDVVIQMGGGIHGHPKGTRKGAMAARQAIEAAVKDISLGKYAETHPELKEAIKQWGVITRA